MSVIGLACLALAGCGSAAADAAPPATPRAPNSAQAAFACLSADSLRDGRDTLVFSDVVVAEETADVVGTEISLWREGGAWRGSVREAEGELGAPRPLQSLTLDPRSGSMALAYANGTGDVFRFTGSFSCARLTGAWRLYPGTPDEPAVLARVRRSGDTPPADDEGASMKGA